MKFVQYLLDTKGELQIPAIPAPNADVRVRRGGRPGGAQLGTGGHGADHALMDLAVKENDYLAQSFLQWFIDEQLEEVVKMDRLLSVIRQSGEKNLLMVEAYLVHIEKASSGPLPEPRPPFRRHYLTGNCHGCVRGTIVRNRLMNTLLGFPEGNVGTSFGKLLRRWRDARGMSQLTLATEAGISTRHVSFLETGRAQPSREMVLRLGGVLDVPLRDRNALLLGAGYAPAYGERPLTAPELEPVRRALD